MPNDNEKKPIDKELEEALKEFESAGGFSGKPKASAPPQKPSATTPVGGVASSSNSVSQSGKQTEPKREEAQDDDFDDFLSDIDDIDGNNRNDEHELSDDELETDTDAHFDDEDEAEPESKGSDGKDKIAVLTKKLKEPKNAIILVVAICFLLFLLLQSGNKKKKIQYQNIENVHEEVLSDVSDVRKNEAVTPDAQVPVSAVPNIPLENITLPNLDITLPDINKSDIDLIPKLPEPKKPEILSDVKPVEKELEKALEIPEPQEIVIKSNKKKTDDILPLEPEMLPQKVRGPITDKTQLKPLVTDFTGGTTIPNMSSKKKVGNDFIFIDTDLDTEVEQNAITATRIQNPENVIAQGRMIDAVLETAINSSIGGQVRAIVARDVYAEVGRNILIPKGTRLYGEYGSGGKSSEGGRIIITWTRIMRPDNVSAAIKSFASDQFGRSGIQGEVDNKGFSSITSSMLLSVIPLVTTIVTNALTNQNPQTTTIGAATGTTTVVQDPINIATQSFTRQISQITSDIIKSVADTKPTVTLDQGTRIKVLVNQDIKLPTYKAVTKSSSGVGGA